MTETTTVTGVACFGLLATLRLGAQRNAFFAAFRVVRTERHARQH